MHLVVAFMQLCDEGSGLSKELLDSAIEAGAVFGVHVSRQLTTAHIMCPCLMLITDDPESLTAPGRVLGLVHLLLLDSRRALVAHRSDTMPRQHQTAKIHE
jgi:hypothetical protein